VNIVSLLPSATEILFAVGAGEDVVAVTFECDHPQEARSRRIVSTSALPEGLGPAAIDAAVRARIAAGEDLYHLDRGALADVDADLVVTQDLCAVCAVDVSEVTAALEHLGCHAEVLTTDPQDLGQVLDSVVQIGSATGHEAEALALVAGLRTRLDAVAARVAGRPRPRTVVLEWTDPPFAPGHWVPEMVQLAGGECVLGRAGQRSVPTTWPDVAAAVPDVVISAPCGFGLEDSVRLAQELLAAGRLPDGVPVWAVDANASFARPGPRLVDGIEALAAVLHADEVPDHAPDRAPDPALARRLR
jgi:iron complex transport system substrate-binding protein